MKYGCEFIRLLFILEMVDTHGSNEYQHRRYAGEHHEFLSNERNGTAQVLERQIVACQFQDANQTQ